MKDLILVSFEPDDRGFLAHIPLDSLVLMDGDSEVLLQKASSRYSKTVQMMRKRLEEMEDMRRNREIIPARKVWEFGESIFSLKKEMERMSFCVNGLYDHLTRELGVKKMWLEKVVIFRRHIPEKKSIPPSLPWGRCSSSPRKAAKAILNAGKP